MVIQYRSDPRKNTRVSPYVVALRVKTQANSPLLRRKIQHIQNGLLGGQEFTPVRPDLHQAKQAFDELKNHRMNRFNL